MKYAAGPSARPGELGRAMDAQQSGGGGAAMKYAAVPSALPGEIGREMDVQKSGGGGVVHGDLRRTHVPNPSWAGRAAAAGGVALEHLRARVPPRHCATSRGSQARRSS